MKLLREPLVHFLALGGLLFTVFAVGKQRPAGRDATNRVIITPFVREQLVAKAQGRAPDAAAIEALIADFVREEILVREARRLGIDREDAIVRGQLRRRMELLAAERISSVGPTESELDDFLRSHPGAFPGADGRTPLQAEIRETVRMAWQRAQRQAAIDNAYQGMRARYEVVVEPSDKSPSK